MKLCTKCNTEKPLDEMVNYMRYGKRYYQPTCKECKAEYQRAYLADKKEHRAKLSREWSKANPEKVVLIRLRQSAKELGFDPDFIEAQYNAHNGLCDICGDPSHKRLAIDHCHKTGAYRGLLCSNCNLMLGNARDQQRILLMGIEYLNRQL